MTLRLRVRWPNAKSPLLANPTVGVLADEVDVPAFAQAPGAHDFVIPDGTLRVVIAVEFNPSIAVNKGDAPTEFLVLSADQAFLTDGTTLLPDPTPFRFANGTIVTQNVHPLIDVVSAGNAAAGLTIAEVRTEFVDITAMWTRRANRAAFDVFRSEREVDTTFLALGATGSTPPLWFVAFPIDLQPPSPEVGTLTFFRPSVTKSYTQPFQADGFETQHALNRYLLAPRDSRSPTIVDGVAQPRRSDSFFFVFQEIFLRASFLRAMVESGKPIVQLHPWPQGGTNFGQAATKKLPTLQKQILRFLRGAGHMGINHPTLTLGRLGIAGYSAGGPATFAAMRANAPLLRELYLFDPMFLATSADAVIQWATRTPDFRLRMTGEVAFGSMQAIAQTVRRRVGAAAAASLSAFPETPARWETTAQGGWPWWNFAIGFHPEDRHDFHNHHQFVLYGGAQFTTLDDGTVTSFVPFLEEFLKGSGY